MRAVVVMRVAVSGTRNGVPWPRPGDTVVLPEAEAAALVAAGLADAGLADAAPAVEAAVLAEGEAATMPKPRKRRRS